MFNVADLEGLAAQTHPARSRWPRTSSVECGPFDPRERGRQHLRELRLDHRDDGEVVGHVKAGRAECAQQAGELPSGRDRSRAAGLRAQQFGGDGERLVRRVRAGEVDAADAEGAGRLLEDVACDQRRVVAGVELVLREVEERDAAMAELGEVGEALLHRGAGVDVDEADPGRVRGAPDQRERVAAGLQPLDPSIVGERLHQDDAVRPTHLDDAGDRLGVGRRGGEQQPVVAGARLLRHPRHEGLLDGDELPVRRGQEEGDRVRSAGREGAGGTVRSVVELGDGGEHPLADLGRDGPLAAERVRHSAERDARLRGDLGHRRRLRLRADRRGSVGHLGGKVIRRSLTLER